MKQLTTFLFLFFCVNIFTVVNVFAQNVGIGTATPSKPLTVKADGIGISQESSTGGAKIGFYTIGTNAYVQTHNAVDLKFATNDSTFSMILKRGSGNLGIGQPNPTAKLDVNGTVKITDGNQGNGKVLTSDAAGNATWQSIGSKVGYKYCKQFTFGSGTFTIPAGVTEVMVEAWGGGSGGVTTTNLTSFVVQIFYIGGTSGGYASTVQTVVPGSNLTYSIGIGSADNVYTAIIPDGGSTTVTFSTGNIVALGGRGHVANSPSPGEALSGTSTLPNSLLLYGNTGSYPTFRTEQTAATDYWKIVSAGNGGMAVGMVDSKLQKGSVYYFLNGVYQYFHKESFNAEKYPSCGGGSDDTGNSGGDGMVLIWYN